jgi:hypothetical protein
MIEDPTIQTNWVNSEERAAQSLIYSDIA